jgi:hypothetical protein
MRPPTRKIETETRSFHKFKPIKFKPIEMVERGVLLILRRLSNCAAPRVLSEPALLRTRDDRAGDRDSHSAAASSARRYGFSGTVSGLPASATATTRTLAGSVLLALRDTA